MVRKRIWFAVVVAVVVGFVAGLYLANFGLPDSARAAGGTVKSPNSIAYHFFNEEGTRFEIYEQIRTTYDGALSLAADMMVWNITKDKIEERMAVTTDEAWSVPGTAKQPPPEAGIPDPMSKITYGGMLGKEVVEAQGDLMREFWKKYDVELSDDVKKAYGVE